MQKPEKECQKQTSPKSYISLILAERILEIFEASGATEVEKLSALDIARCLVPLAPGSIYSKTLDAEESVGQRPQPEP